MNSKQAPVITIIFALFLQIFSSQNIIAADTNILTPFNQQMFSKYQAENKPIVLMIYAPWCLHCRVQKPKLETVLKDPQFKDFIAMQVDYGDKKLLKQLNILHRSTIVVYKGKTEISRVVWFVSEQDIKSLLLKALEKPMNN